MQHKILVSNIGYARDIDGAVHWHLLRMHRHIRTPKSVQLASLDEYKRIVEATRPDLCCLIEVDTGSSTSGGFDQFAYLEDPAYPYRDVVNKYAENSKLAKFAATRGKCNGFMARHPYRYDRLYLSCGSKRLLYRIELEEGLTLFFTHLSLKRPIRAQQMVELRLLADKEAGEVIFAGDFNILAGLDELKLLTGDGKYKLINSPDDGTFTLFGRHYLLDLCIASRSVANRLSVNIIEQGFSDHDALLISIDS